MGARSRTSRRTRSTRPPRRLQPVLAVSSDGPPAEIVDLCAWAAHHWAGPLVTFLRAATAPNVVAPGPVPERETAVYPSLLEPGHPWSGDALIVVPPTRPFSVRPLLAPEGSTLVLVPGVHEAARAAAALAEDGREVVLLGGARCSCRPDARVAPRARRARVSWWGVAPRCGPRCPTWRPSWSSTKATRPTTTSAPRRGTRATSRSSGRGGPARQCGWSHPRRRSRHSSRSGEPPAVTTGDRGGWPRGRGRRRARPGTGPGLAHAGARGCVAPSPRPW